MCWAGETNSDACVVCCSELSGRGGNDSAALEAYAMPLVEGLLGGVVCGGRGATCSITLGGRWIRGCLQENTSSRICKICFKKSTSRRASADTTLAPLTCGSAVATVDIARLAGDWPCDSPRLELNTNTPVIKKTQMCTHTSSVHATV